MGEVARRPKNGGNVSRVRVLLVDDNDDFLDGVAAWLQHDPQLEILGRAHSGPEALERVEKNRPGLVLMDISMPDINGFEVTREIKSRPEAPLVVLMSFHESHTAQLEAWAAGADGFVAKSQITERLMPLLRALVRQRGLDEKEVETSLSTKPGPPRDLTP